MTSAEAAKSTFGTAADITDNNFEAYTSTSFPNVSKSNTTDTAINGYAFRGYRYATAAVQFRLLGQGYNLCFDSSCTISIIDRLFLTECLLGIISNIKQMPTFITVKGFGDKLYNTNEYIKLKMYIPGYNNHTALIERELHIMQNLNIKALIGIDIIAPEAIVLDFNKQTITIDVC